MIPAWRVVQAKYARSAFGGKGARRSGGRFNSRGTSVVYAADSFARALLEVAVHLPSYHGLRGRVAFSLRIPEATVETLGEADLPADWRATPPARAAQLLGDVWVAEARSAVLRVPSAVVPHAHNLVLNPEHLDFVRLEVGPAEAIPVDPRLLN